ncbi:MAG: hypothetical protein J0652_09250 [Desulfobulbaceae bacterium]|nr:hypothetical protein [Desulfobulbaceae bacterium]
MLNSPDERQGRHTTVKEHMPVKHQKYMEWTPERFKNWAAKIGPETLCLTETLLVQRAHPQQAYRSLLGILSLGKSYGDARLEAACCRALYINAFSYRSVASILKSGLDHKPLPEPVGDKKPVEHANIRGQLYYSSNTH